MEKRNISIYMTPKEKAEELVKKYVNLLKKTDSCLAEKCENNAMCQHNWYLCEGWLFYAKQCALIAVDEILLSFTALSYGVVYLGQIDYWQAVKQEIENI